MDAAIGCLHSEALCTWLLRLQVSVRDADVSSNNAQYGAGVEVSASSSVAISNSRFHNNNGTYGGGVSAQDSAKVTIGSCNFAFNVASQHGAGIYATIEPTVSEECGLYTGYVCRNIAVCVRSSHCVV